MSATRRLVEWTNTHTHKHPPTHTQTHTHTYKHTQTNTHTQTHTISQAIQIVSLLSKVNDHSYWDNDQMPIEIP